MMFVKYICQYFDFFVHMAFHGGGCNFCLIFGRKNSMMAARALREEHNHCAIFCPIFDKFGLPPVARITTEKRIKSWHCQPLQ
ncbi:MAG: hypothetical protein K2L95_02940 [Alphaproteobacteria bacterium]|nr:hypothetical protein [Alphaproteobacteria bacterium]